VTGHLGLDNLPAAATASLGRRAEGDLGAKGPEVLDVTCAPAPAHPVGCSASRLWVNQMALRLR
jgi:hypothetical protein